MSDGDAGMHGASTCDVHEPHVGPPTTSSDSKRVMLRAERGDSIRVDGRGEFEVAKRTDPYFGPKLLLFDEGETENHLLTAPGPNTGLLFWEPVTDEEGFREGWNPVEEVAAELADAKQYDICSTCGEPIKTAEHGRQSLFGLCAGGQA